MSAVREPGIHRIRAMRLADVAAVVEIERRAYDFPWTRGVFRDCLRVGYSCWLMELGDTVAGYLIMSISAGEAHVLNLCVDPANQGRGLGAQLLEHGLCSAVRLGAETAFLEVRPSNIPAIRLYERLGFGEVGTRPRYYPGHGGNREDARIFARVLSPGSGW